MVLKHSIVIVALLSFLGSADADPAGRRAFFDKLVEAAIERTHHSVTYDGSYRSINYPGGDVPDTIGVCADVIVRIYRTVGIDLQKEIHEDMSDNFAAYPKTWGLKKPDTNIDHRRVLNLQVFFRRKGSERSPSKDPDKYKPGDLVTWVIPGNLPHIGIVINRKSKDGKRPLIVHNIGRGPESEDILFTYHITGHYRYPKPDGG